MTRACIAIVLAAAILGCSKPPEKTSAAADLPSPAGAGAAYPFLSTARDGVLASWLEPVSGSDRTALRFARHRNGRWSEARTIVEGRDLVVNWADFPSIVEDARGALFAQWLQQSGTDEESYDIRMATSVDDGATWSAPLLVNRGSEPGEHGFVSLAALADGGVAATWLDGRAGGETALRFAHVSAGGTFTRDAQLDARTCECCATGMAMTSSGPVVVYRDRSPDEIRDIAHVRLDARGWSAPRLVHADNWKINGCPVNGPQVDAIGNRAAAAWFTSANDRPRVSVAFSDDGGATFGNAVAVDEGKPLGRVDVVMLDDATAIVTWVEQTGQGAQIRARHVTRDGKTAASFAVADTSAARTTGSPRMARNGSEVWLAWTEHDGAGKRIRFRSLR